MTALASTNALPLLSRTMESLLAPQYIFFANNADGRVHDGIVYGSSENDWVYGEDGLFPAMLYLAERHYKDSFFEGDYAIPPENGTLAQSFGIDWIPDPSFQSRTGYRAQISETGLQVSPSVILLFVHDAIERMHQYSYRKVKDWRFEIDDGRLLEELEEKKIVNANGLLDLFQMVLAPLPEPETENT
ncbi:MULTISPECIES: hypothetical protein [Undibacterium]|jgi:hypothetical protein|uniref:Uncharacterized protein n=1 Tax=Undibacterium umbellatum TaxID=2762300 RepID=A0ABR6ZGB9_9BURK|nr:MULTISPECIES: hypothetical protein [Undibacterium]MBC3910775.1 hypothetical protein [Undibacterium umbellatum]MDP1977832.1 hypothetical protein [Undibacterium sp.]